MISSSGYTDSWNLDIFIDCPIFFSYTIILNHEDGSQVEFTTEKGVRDYISNTNKKIPSIIMLPK